MQDPSPKVISFWIRLPLMTAFLFFMFGTLYSAADVNCGLGQSCPDEHQCCRIGISVWCCPTAVSCDYDIDDDWTGCTEGVWPASSNPLPPPHALQQQSKTTSIEHSDDDLRRWRSIASKGDSDELQKLLDQRVSPDQRIYGRTLLHYVVMSGNPEAVNVLLKAGANPNVHDQRGSTPLTALLRVREQRRPYLTVQGINQVTEALLEGGANPNLAHKIRGRAPLHFAATKGLFEATDILLRSGAQPNAKDNFGTTPLLTAAKTNPILLAESILPLPYSPEEGLFRVISLLLDAGASPHVQDDIGSSPLHYVGKFGNDRAIRVLVRMGAHLNHTNSHGSTPLHLAISSASYMRHVKGARTLLSLNADPNFQNNEGHTPMDLILELERKGRGSWARLAKPQLVKALQKSCASLYFDGRSIYVESKRDEEIVEVVMRRRLRPPHGTGNRRWESFEVNVAPNQTVFAADGKYLEVEFLNCRIVRNF